MRLFLLLNVVVLFQRVLAQTATITNAAGLTVVQVVTTDPIAHSPITTTILTLSASSTSAAPIPDDPGVQQGPVGQPAPTPDDPGGPTPYTYTTVINGVTTRVADIFTPTNPATTPPSVPAIGTVMDYSSWLAVYGPPSTTAGAISVSPPYSPTLWTGILLSSVVALLSGCWVLL
ncbi:hypothetical protein BDN72DRAFT_844508 [Pluteus cervinus]|uniref:Uncharacterized protein n=1 Tax=Pluteus cervinus TaxID=181527 RepID=A0ACD3AK94_9AGAR|nr:hypothetical protein BDN72DRAFT_844508 [Pluteus cervinus]